MICPECLRPVAKYCNRGHPTRRARPPTEEEVKVQRERERRVSWFKIKLADARLAVEQPEHRAWMYRRGSLKEALLEAAALNVITLEKARDLLDQETVRALGRDLDVLAQLGRGHCLRCDRREAGGCRRAGYYEQTTCQCGCHRPGLRATRRDVTREGEAWLMAWSLGLAGRVMGFWRDDDIERRRVEGEVRAFALAVPFPALPRKVEKA